MPQPTPLPITIIAGTLPTGAVYNPQTYFNAIVARMSATVSGGNVVWGQLGGSRPSGPLPGNGAQAGLWYGDPFGGSGYWNDYNTDAALYLPIRNVCGQYINGLLRLTDFVCGAMTANTTITTPDKSGIMALISDIPQQLGTQTYSGTNITVDCNANRAPVYIVMTGNTTVSLTNIKDGELIEFWLENRSQDSGTTYTISIVGAAWASGFGQMVGLSPGVSGFRVIDHVRVFRAGGYSFGEIISKNHQIGISSDGTLPAPVSAVMSDNNTIAITMNAVLLGNAALATAGFAVLVNGIADAVVSASCSGQTVLVNLSTNVPTHATVTVRYSGTDMKSIAGNTVPTFGPINVLSSGGGGGGIHNNGTGTSGLGTGGQTP